jgi:hypothetical protein
MLVLPVAVYLLILFAANALLQALATAGSTGVQAILAFLAEVPLWVKVLLLCSFTVAVYDVLALDGLKDAGIFDRWTWVLYPPILVGLPWLVLFWVIATLYSLTWRIPEARARRRRMGQEGG